MVKMYNRVTLPQLELLARCFEEFPSLSVNRSKGREEMGCVKKKWNHIAAALNSIKPGITKSGNAWLRYWTIYKYGLRKKYPQFQSSWVSDKPAVVTPIEGRFLKVLSEFEKNHPHNKTDQNVEIYPTTDDEEKDVAATSNSQETLLTSMPTKPESSKATKIETSQPIPTLKTADETLEHEFQSSGQDKQDNNEQDIDEQDKSDQDDEDNKSKEDLKKSKFEIEKQTIQAEILKFNLKRQKEMHELEMEQMKEMHALEMEILQLKKIKLMRYCGRSNGEESIND